MIKFLINLALFGLKNANFLSKNILKIITSVPGVSADVQLHLPVVPESLSADVALERRLARVEAHVDLEPVPVRVLARAVAAHERGLQLKDGRGVQL
jgi:hypothetical protein